MIRTGLGVLENFAPYHFLLTTSWTGFLAVVSSTYLVLNLAFAVAYLACGPDALVGARKRRETDKQCGAKDGRAHHPGK